MCISRGLRRRQWRAGTQAAEVIFTRGAVSSVIGGGGYYIDQVEKSLSVFPELVLLRNKDDVLVERASEHTI